MGTPVKPSTSTGVEGPASLAWLPLSSISARTRANSVPATTMSPTLSVPRWTSTVATAPRPRSSLASMTRPSARPSRGTCSSSTSACSRMVSSSLSRPVFLTAETSTSSVSPPIDFDLHIVLQQLGAHPQRIGRGLIHLVDGDDDRHARRLGVLDGFDGLRHDAVVGRHDQHGDVGRLRAAGAHGGERLVARGIEEGDLLAVHFDLIGADVLGDAARLAGHDVGLADGVEQRGLAVVDVAHDGHDRGAAASDPRPCRRRRRRRGLLRRRLPRRA